MFTFNLENPPLRGRRGCLMPGKYVANVATLLTFCDVLCVCTAPRGRRMSGRTIIPTVGNSHNYTQCLLAQKPVLTYSFS